MVVETDESRARECLGHQNGRRAMATADVGNGNAAFEFFANAIECRNPFVDEMGGVAWPEEALSAAEQARVMLVPADAASGLESLGDLGLIAQYGSDDFERTGH